MDNKAGGQYGPPWYSAESPSDTVARRVRELRASLRMSAADLAGRCAEEGMPEISAQVIYKLEGQRSGKSRAPRPVTVDELFILARALQVTASELLAGTGGAKDPHSSAGVRAYADSYARHAATLAKLADQLEQVEAERAADSPGFRYITSLEDLP